VLFIQLHEAVELTMGIAGGGQRRDDDVEFVLLGEGLPNADELERPVPVLLLHVRRREQAPEGDVANPLEVAEERSRGVLGLADVEPGGERVEHESRGVQDRP